MAGMFLTLALAAALAYWVMLAKDLDRMAAAPWVKAAAVAGLAAESWVLGVPFFVTLALALGACGDFALTRRGEKAFLLGMAAFAAGHLAYALGFWARGQDLVALGLGGQAGWAVLVPLVVFMASTEVWLQPATGALRWPVRGYVAVIGLMVAVVLLLPDHGGRGMLLAGAGLFLLSDLLLALRLFVAKGERQGWWLSVTLWPAYWVGQVLLMLGGLIYGRLAP